MAKRNRSRNTRFEVRSYNEQERMSTTRRIMSYLRSLANRRSSGVVSADDVHNYLTRDGVREQQTRTRLSFINSVFSSEMFEQVGMTASTRPQARGRAIATYTVA
jgi:predicted Zn-dependent protease